MQADQYGRSALASQLLGSWAGAPKAAKAEYSHFLQLVSRILGGEASAQEVEVSISGVPQSSKTLESIAVSAQQEGLAAPQAAAAAMSRTQALIVASNKASAMP